MTEKTSARPTSEPTNAIDNNDAYEILILNNKDDGIADTFCYRLFEDKFFDRQLCEALCNAALKHSGNNDAVVDTIRWVISGVDICLNSHLEIDDLYKISNYTPTIKNEWFSHWRPILQNKCNPQHSHGDQLAFFRAALRTR